MDPLLPILFALTALWLAILSVVVILLVRQIGVLTVRLTLNEPRVDLNRDGPEVGGVLPSEVTNMEPALARGRVPLLVISASCMPCRELITAVDGGRLDPATTVLLAGRSELATGLASALPPGVRVLRDSAATQVAEVLSIKSAPFGVLLGDGRVLGKVVPPLGRRRVRAGGRRGGPPGDAGDAHPNQGGCSCRLTCGPYWT